MEDLRRWRRELHQIPELGLQEYQTAAYIRKELEAMGYKWQSVVETGTIVFIDHHQKETIAFRSDIDGLAVEEKTGLDYCSRHQGFMHACGHDGHMSALLGLAKKLKDTQDCFSYNVLLIFQPAEEAPGGARFIVESGVFKKYNVVAIFGMHLMPLLEEGKISCKSGPMMAMNGEIDVHIMGKGAHAGLPHQGIDSLLIASQTLTQYQTIISRNLSPFESAIIHIGNISGGTARNSVAASTTMRGTLRCYDETIFNDIVKKIDHIHKGLEESYGCHIEWSCPPMYPPVINDDKLYHEFVSMVGHDFIPLKTPLMLAEDFSFYQKEIPGLFFFLGTKCDEFESGLHTETFNFHEDVLKKAVDLYYQLAIHFKVK